jgi:hypothetical protein
MVHPLPDFVIIGATKSATTWLLQNLQAHPDVFMPDPELHFFSREFERGAAWYRAQFAGAPPGRVIGEKSASYLPHPAVPTRLKALLPEARLIVQLRNPIERAYSAYCMHFRRGEVGEDIEHYLGDDSPHAERLRAGGLYFRHISRFLELFAREQLCVTLYDDLDRDPAGVLNRVRQHIGLATTEVGEPVIELKVKDKAEPHVPLPARRLLAPLKSLVQPFRDHAWFRAARSTVARPIRYPALSLPVRDKLRTYYRDDVCSLSDLLGRDLSVWLDPPAEKKETVAA